MANRYDCPDGRFCFVQWENDADFVCSLWRTTVEALDESLFEFLKYSPRRLVVLKVVNASLQDELLITSHLDTIAPSVLLSQWRPNHSLLQEAIRNMPCHTRQARSAIGHYKGRLLWRPGNDSSITKTSKEIIIELLGTSLLPMPPAALQALSASALPRQTVYNTLSRLHKEGLVCRPDGGLYALTEAGKAFCEKLVKKDALRKNVRSLCP